MKQLTFKLILPMTIFSLAFFTKWWYVEVNEGDFKEILTGFPLPYKCPGWHTSLSLQIFIYPLIVNIITHFIFWFTLIYFINRFIKKIRLGKILTILLIISSGLCLTTMLLIASNSDNVYSAQPEFHIKVIETGYGLVWDLPNRYQF